MRGPNALADDAVDGTQTTGVLMHRTRSCMLSATSSHVISLGTTTEPLFSFTVPFLAALTYMSSNRRGLANKGLLITLSSMMAPVENKHKFGIAAEGRAAPNVRTSEQCPNPVQTAHGSLSLTEVKHAHSVSSEGMSWMINSSVMAASSWRKWRETVLGRGYRDVRHGARHAQQDLYFVVVLWVHSKQGKRKRQPMH